MVLINWLTYDIQTTHGRLNDSGRGMSEPNEFH